MDGSSHLKQLVVYGGLLLTRKNTAAIILGLTRPLVHIVDHLIFSYVHFYFNMQIATVIFMANRCQFLIRLLLWLLQNHFIFCL